MPRLVTEFHVVNLELQCSFENRIRSHISTGESYIFLCLSCYLSVKQCQSIETYHFCGEDVLGFGLYIHVTNSGNKS